MNIWTPIEKYSVTLSLPYILTIKKYEKFHSIYWIYIDILYMQFFFIFFLIEKTLLNIFQTIFSCNPHLNPQGSSTAIFQIAEVMSSNNPGGRMSFWFSALMPSCNNCRTWVRVMWKEGAVASRPGLNTGKLNI